MGLRDILGNLPEVEGPTQKRLPFNEKLKWTLIVLVIFYILGGLSLYGLDPKSQFQFEQLEIILGAKFGSVITLGIGPLVTASIVLQLLVGAGIMKLDLTKAEDKSFFQGLQKASSIFFILFEGFIYVYMGGLSPPAALQGTSQYPLFKLLLVLQLFIGGFLIMFLDEVVSKWGFGSGISLFIAAGVSQELFIKLFSPLDSPTNPGSMVGAVPVIFQALAAQDITTVMIKLATILATLAVFALAIFGQAMKVEIPLSFGRVRGQGIRWPLSFIYTSNIPVILVSAFMANIQLWAKLLQNWGYPLLGKFSGNTPISGIVVWFNSPDVVGKLIKGGLAGADIVHALVYMLFMVVGAVIFSIFWVQTSGMDAKTQAKNMISSGLQIPGFRKDERILESILNRYIMPLTVMGAIFVGILASLADVSGALTRGTGILLTVMIVYKLYEDIARQHMMDMSPLLRKFIKE